MPYEMGIPYRDGRTVVYDRCDFPQQLRRALDLFDYDGWRRRQTEARAAGRRIGIGMSSFVEGSGVGPHEGAVIKVDLSGHVTVATGAQPHGQSLETTLAQVAADQLGVDPANVSVRHGDTSVITHGVGTFASRSAVTAGNAVAVAAVRLRNKILRIATTLLEVDVQDLQLEGGLVFPRGAAGRALNLGEIAKAAAPGPRNSVPPGMDPGLQIEYYFYPPTVTWASGTNVVAAEVDEETGFVKLLDYVSVDDCGRMLNPMVVEGQIHGGIAHGIGNAMLEEALYDDDGQFLSATYMDYLLPTSAEVPPIRVDHQEFLSELNPLGVKGVGEGGAVSPPAAIANAVVDAFRPLRVEITRAPITPESVLRAILKAKQTSFSEL
jgi:carbon-monoxide dehydrogenase large subunit